MFLVHRERTERPEWFGLEFPELFRRMFDTREEAGLLRVEEFIDGDTLVVRVELPGIDPDKDVELSVAGGVLRIQARREERTERTDEAFVRSEFRYGSFVRAVALPEGVDESAIAATYDAGVLEIRVPLPTEAVKPPVTTVPITRA